VLATHDPREALLVLQHHEGAIKILLTDVVMPAMSGRQLAETVARMRPGTRILFMSGYTDDAILHHGVLDSGFAFLQKPLTPDSLSRKVREVLDVKTRESGSASDQ
jgi:two-component system, cell cycle sensor histidine kinase and response regulator CckA